jgi:hypothetical protein
MRDFLDLPLLPLEGFRVVDRHARGVEVWRIELMVRTKILRYRDDPFSLSCWGSYHDWSICNALPYVRALSSSRRLLCDGRSVALGLGTQCACLPASRRQAFDLAIRNMFDVVQGLRRLLLRLRIWRREREGSMGGHTSMPLPASPSPNRKEAIRQPGKFELR